MPVTVAVGSVAVEWLCLAIIQLVSGSRRRLTYLRTPLWGPVSRIVLIYLLAAAVWAFAFVVVWTLPHVAILPGYSWGIIAIAGAAIIASLLEDRGNARRSRGTRPTPPTPSTEPDQPL